MASVPEAMAVALSFHQAGHLQEAEQIYRKILEVKPDEADAHNNLGMVLQKQGQLSEAVDCYRLALALKPFAAEIHNNLGTAFSDQGLPDDAVACYIRALELRADYAEAHFNLGNAWMARDRRSEAVASYQRAVELMPHLAAAHHNLGIALADQGKPDDAISYFHKALALQPNLAETYSHLGNALKDQASLDEAIACYRRALELKPDFVAAHSSLVYTLYFHPGYDAAAIYEHHRAWNARHAAPLARFIQPHANDPSPSRRLRVGYVSPNFREHVTCFSLAPVLSSHDHQQFQIFAYADIASPDGLTARLRSYVDVWQDITRLSDDRVAQLIRQDQIDILVDGTMHMDRNRLLVFARKPAPVQVCWLAYPGTTGLSTIDYRLTDPYLDPPGLDDAYYAEQSIRLPDSFWCYDPLTIEPAVNSLPAIGSGQVTFGCLNNFCKVNDGVLKLWANVLNLVKSSQLVLLAGEGSHRERTIDFLKRQGVASERIKFVGRQPRPHYLATYHDIDIGLDTVPYNGHTTSLDAYWMGVPVVTLVGKTVVGRAGVSQLINLGLPELIAQTPEQYVHIAAELASNLSRLADLRATMRDRMKRSPLMDAPRFAQRIETAYRQLWQQWCAARRATPQ